MSILQAGDRKADIMVIDDTPENLAVISHMLTERGYRVRSVTKGSNGLRGAKAAPPDLILLDINMPEMNGYEVCQQLKADERTRDIPVIFLSALVDVFDKVRAFTCGAVDYITKPFQVEEVLARLETHLTICRLQKQLKQQNAKLKQEIAERERVEKSLRESEAKIAQFLEAMPVGVFVTNDRGQACYVNSHAHQLLGNGIVSTDNEEQNREAYQLYLANSEQPYPEDKLPIVRALRGESTIAEDIEIRKNDKIIPLEVRATPIWDDNGNIAYAIAAFTDISERKIAEEAKKRAIEIENRALALRESQRRLAQFLEAMPVGVFVVDANGQSYYVNSRAQQLLSKGLVVTDNSEQLREAYQVYLAGSDRIYPKERDPLLNALSGRTVTIDDMEIRQPDKTIPVEVWATPIWDDRGNISYAIAAFTDITERKIAEDTKKRAIEAENRALELELENKEKSLSTLKLLFDEIHNQPLNDLKFLIKSIRDRELTPCQGRENIPDEQILLERLQTIDQKLRSIYDRQAKQIRNPEAASLCLGGDVRICLKSPFHEILYQIYQYTINRDSPHFRKLKVSISKIESLQVPNLDTEDKINICRFLEEALCNVGEHAAGATRVKVTFTQNNGFYLLSVEDNGQGLSCPSTNERLGSKNALDLAKKLGGEFRRFSPSSFGTGTTCELTWPI